MTAGCNQAFANVALTLLDPGDTCVVFRPYYFNHLMQLQMLGVEATTPRMTADLLPDVAALEAALADGARMCVVVNPGNPTGTTVPRHTLEACAEACARAGAWLVVDNTSLSGVFENLVRMNSGRTGTSCSTSAPTTRASAATTSSTSSRSPRRTA